VKGCETDMNQLTQALCIVGEITERLSQGRVAASRLVRPAAAFSILLILLGAWCAASNRARAGNSENQKPREFFVSPAGCDTNSGSEGAPCSRIATVLSRASGGDVITLLPGTYNEAIEIEISGTLQQPTTIRSQGKWGAIIKPAEGHGVYVADGVTNVLIDGLQVAEAKIDGIKVGSYATVRNCWIHHSAHQGLSAHNTRGTVVEYNLIEHNGTDTRLDHGIYLSGTNDIVRGNVIRWNKTYGCQIYYDPPSSSADCEFYNNLVYGNRDALTVWSPAGQTNYVFNNTLVSGNFVVQADYGTLCLTNNILVGPSPKRLIYAEDRARVLADYNLTSVRGTVRGPHDVTTSDPGFINPSAGLYWLRRDSEARGRAVRSIVPPVDFFGLPEHKAYDVGALQFRARYAADGRVLDPSAQPDYWSTNAFTLK